MFKLVKKIVKWSAVSVVVLTGYGIYLNETDPNAKHFSDYMEEAAKPEAIETPKIVPTKAVVNVVLPQETEAHKQCRLELHAENRGGDTLVWDTKDFGTYDDGDVWVGYNRKTDDRVWYDLVKIC
jgi:hypothetical protein